MKKLLLFYSVSCIRENFCPETLLKPHFPCSGEPEMRETRSWWNRLLRMLKQSKKTHHARYAFQKGGLLYIVYFCKKYCQICRFDGERT